MALQRQNIPISFMYGVETKTDDKQNEIGYLKRLENAIFDTLKTLRKRNGYEQVLTKDISNTQITNATSLSKFKKELAILTDEKYYSYSQSLTKWSDKGKIFTAYPTSSPVIRNDYNKSNVDLISSENLNVYAYEDSRGISITIKDNESENFILSDQLISASGTKPVLTSIQNKVFIFYKVSNSIRLKTLNILSPSVISSELTIVSDLNATNHNFDAVQYGNKNVIAYQNSSAVLSLLSVDIDGVPSSTTTLSGQSAASCVDLYVDSQSRIIVSYSDNSTVKLSIRSSSVSGQILAPTTIETIANVKNVTSIQCSDLDSYYVAYEVEGSSSTTQYIKLNTITNTGTIGTPSTILKSVGLASKLICIEDFKTFIPCIHQSTLQSTYFISDIEGSIVSKISPSIGGTLITKGSLPKVSYPTDTKVLFPSLVKSKVVTDDGTFYSLLGVNSTTINFQPSDPYQEAELGENLHISGGILKCYDGNYVSEHGFFLYPENLTSPSTTTSGGFMSDGIYQYTAVYAWTDAYGQTHRSAPSTPLSITLEGATTTQTVTVRVPTLRLTDKQNVIIELYRTEAAGDIFYKVSSTTSPNFNVKTSDTIDIVDTLADADILSREILYTTGGVLENIQAPSSTIAESFNDRIFLAGLEDKNKIVYSKIRDENEAVEFNDALYKFVNNFGGNLTSLKTMDDKLIILKEDALYYISGDGPNDLGEQDSFIEPSQISSDVGAIDSKSVILTPNGLMFKSRKGIYLLDRGLNTQYVGAAVEDFNDLTITSAVIVPELDQVRFTTSNGECLVFNYLTNQWATFKNHKALSAVSILNDYYYLRTDGVLYKENKTIFSDNGSAIPMVLETSWISFADMQNFKRVYRLHLLGEFKSKHKIRIRIAYNFKEAFIHEKIIDTADFTSDTAYGDSSPYGSESVYGGTGNLHQLRLDLKQQKCQSIKIRIEEIQDVETGEGLSLSNIMFEVGIKGTGNKPDQSRVYGSNE